MNEALLFVADKRSKDIGSLDHAIKGISKKANWYLTQLDRFRQFGETGEAKEIRPNRVYLNPAYLKASRLIIVNIVNGG